MKVQWKKCSVNDCPRQGKRKGLCTAHFARHRGHGMLDSKPRITGTLEERFWSKVRKQKHDECWLWIGQVDDKGYGVMHTGRGTRGKTLAHRFLFEIASGREPGKKFVCHHCDNPPCVNPAHLYLGNPKSNMDDKVKRKRHTFGTKCHNAVLDTQKAQIIRNEYASGDYSYQHLATRHGVSPSTIARVVKGVSWRNGEAANRLNQAPDRPYRITWP